MKLQSILQNQAQKEVTINQNFEALDHASFGSYNPLTTGGLTFGYIGGLTVNSSGVEQTLNDGSIYLTASSINYIEYNQVNNAIVSNTTGFTNGRIALYTVNTNTVGLILPIVKHKIAVQQPYGTALGGGSGGGASLGTATPLAPSSTPTAGTATLASHEDHVHPLPVGLLPIAGIAGQVLSKIDSTNYNVQWVTPATGTGGSYTLPIATSTTLGGIKVGTGLAVTADGTLSSTATGGGSTPLTTSNTFEILAVTGLTVTVSGGKHTSSSPFKNPTAISDVATKTLTLLANNSGYICISANVIEYTDSDIPPDFALCLYYYVTNGSSITTLQGLSRSFRNTNLTPFFEVFQSAWNLGTVYTFASPYSRTNTSANTPNMFPGNPMLYCLTDELGYFAGDLVTIDQNSYAIQMASFRIRIITNAQLPKILSRASGSIGVSSTITQSNWAIILEVKPAQ